MGDQQFELSRLKHTDIETVGKETLADVDGLALDPGIPLELRAGHVLTALGNPYCFRAGGLAVKLEFAQGGPALQEMLIRFCRRKKSGLTPTGPAGTM